MENLNNYIGLGPRGSGIYEMLKNDFIYGSSEKDEIRLVWKLLWDKGIEFKSINPIYDYELIFFIRNNITKIVNEELQKQSYVLYIGTDRQLIL